MTLMLQLLLPAVLLTSLAACAPQDRASGTGDRDTSAMAARVSANLPDVCTGIDTSLLVSGDSAALRAAAAARYVEIFPTREIVAMMSDSIAAHLPPSQRQAYVELMTQHTDYEALDLIFCNAVAKHMTFDEIEAAVAFYGSPAGQAALRKVTLYMTEILPAVELEMMRAAARARRQAL